MSASEHETRLAEAGDRVLAHGCSFVETGTVMGIAMDYRRTRRQGVLVLVNAGEFAGRRLYFADDEVEVINRRTDRS